MTAFEQPRLRLRSGAGRWVLVACILASSAIGIDGSVVNVALPRLGLELGATFADLQWVVLAYTLTLASLILLGGSLGDRFGRRRVLVVGLSWFAIASIGCAVAPDVGWLVALRAVQGTGGALATPASLAIIEAEFVPEDAPRAIGLWAGVGGIASAIAPFVGGAFITWLSWRTVFALNLPLVLVVVLIAYRHMPEGRSPDAAGLDLPGALLSVVGLAALTEGLIAAPAAGLLTLSSGGALALGLVVLAAFIGRERRAARPMLPLGIFRSSTFSATNVSTVLDYGAFGVFFLLFPVALQVVGGVAAVAAGAALLPVTAVTFLLSGTSGRIAAKIGPRTQMTVGPLVCAAGVALTTMLVPGGATWPIALSAATVFGLGLATLVAPLTTTALVSAPAEHAGLASGVNNAAARAGSLLAIAAVPAIAGLTGSAYDDPARFASGFRLAAWVCVGVLGAGAMVAALGIRSRSTEDSADPAPAQEEELA